jgi:hypothetical protein
MALREVSRSPLDLHISILLRALVPYRKLGYSEALFYAEQQATVFLKLVHLHEPPVPIEELACQVGLTTEIIDGACQQALAKSTLGPSGDWIITLDPKCGGDRRFIVAHELKHILDDGFGAELYRPVDVMTIREREEHVSNYFAACLLMPRPWLERYRRRGIHNVEDLAGLFGTSPERMQLRLEALGLIEDDLNL